ncbi:unnamed protein product [Polarella glacialis]|uniref:Uncharacterized protein n=1 Tax=Polarella glacialis TaxID=89957 RepID=A0A813L546_POLGL|nr:unnamed protein product [Polarella glacialis]
MISVTCAISLSPLSLLSPSSVAAVPFAYFQHSFRCKPFNFCCYHRRLFLLLLFLLLLLLLLFIWPLAWPQPGAELELRCIRWGGVVSPVVAAGNELLSCANQDAHKQDATNLG